MRPLARTSTPSAAVSIDQSSTNAPSPSSSEPRRTAEWCWQEPEPHDKLWHQLPFIRQSART
ncbi:hypothetical protein KUCAC02_001555, partial [Chaenocephalus aceratus]